MNLIFKYSVIIFSGVLLSACGSEQENVSKQVDPVLVTIVTPSAGSQTVVTVSGQVTSAHTAIISTRVMGFVNSVLVKNGAMVKQGQLLATINSDDILAKRAQATAVMKEAEATLDQAKRDYDRFTELHKQQSASTKEYENITLHYESVKSKVEAARQMQREADAMLTYTHLTAPFSGVVVQKNIEAGSMANPGMPLFVIEQPGQYEVRAAVNEQDIAKIRKGSAASVIIKSVGKNINGIVTEVSPSSSFNGGQYSLVISLPQNESKEIYSGMSVNVSIATTSSQTQTDTAIRIPVKAAFVHDQLTGLYTITENNTALLHWVRLGKRTGDEVEILSGLTAQEQVILDADGKLYNGAPVKIK